MAQTTLASLSLVDLDARREKVAERLRSVQSEFSALTFELLARRLHDLAPTARYLDLHLNPDYENGPFWEFTDLLDADEVSLFYSATRSVGPDLNVHLFPIIQHLFDQEFSADYTDSVGLLAGSYFDLLSREPLDDLPVPSASL